MKKIELLCIGEQKFSNLVELEKKYLKKINFFADFRIKVIKDPGLKHETLNQKKEGELIAAHLKSSNIVIACDEKGRQMDSRGFSAFLLKKMEETPKIVFLIGGHLGLSRELDDWIDFKVSFSKMTFPHDLFRLLLLEQVYRAFTIHRNIKYHR